MAASNCYEKELLLTLHMNNKYIRHLHVKYLRSQHTENIHKYYEWKGCSINIISNRDYDYGCHDYIIAQSRGYKNK